MENNKQSMKLYTADQVLKMLEVCRDSDLYEHILTFEDILKTETPIELPSDDDKELFYQKQVTNPYPAEEYAYTAYEKGFMEGAKTVINKIQVGNK